MGIPGTSEWAFPANACLQVYVHRKDVSVHKISLFIYLDTENQSTETEVLSTLTWKQIPDFNFHLKICLYLFWVAKN